MSESTLYFNGTIYTMDAANTCCSAMLVTDGKIAATGSDADLLAGKPENTQTVDLQGRVVLPGLVEGHTHVAITGRRMLELELSGKSKEEILALVREKAETLPEGQWLCGSGWSQDDWADKTFPTAAELDAAAPRNPVRLIRCCGNAYWCSGKAMELAGVTPDPAQPGILTGPACRSIDDAIPDYTPEQYRQMLSYLQEIFLSQGITAVMEKGAAAQSPLTVTGGKPVVELMHRLSQSGWLKLRLHQAVIGLDPYADEAFQGAWEPFCYEDRLSVRSVKFWTDGAFGPRSAHLSKDYRDRPGHRGSRWFADEDLIALFRKFDALGVQIEVHTIGDASTTQVLDCYEAAFADALDKDRRFIIDHVHVPKPEDILRMGRLNIINSTQFIQFSDDMGFLPEVLPEEMLPRVYPWRAVLDAGCRIVNGSDMDPVNPFLMLYVAIARKNEQGVNTLEAEPLQKLTRLEALRSCTTDAAYAMFMEDRIGSLEAGKHADFIFLDRDYFACPEEEIRDIRVEATYISGQPVFSR